MATNIGHGCRVCRPDLFALSRPYGNPGYSDSDTYQRTHPGESLSVFVDGKRARFVIEAMQGERGWIIRQHTNAAVLSQSGAHLCHCGSDEVEVEMWIGTVRCEPIPMPMQPLPLRQSGTLPRRRRIVG